MDPADELDRVYEAVVHWADVILVSTPIRWGVAGTIAEVKLVGGGRKGRQLDVKAQT